MRHKNAVIVFFTIILLSLCPFNGYATKLKRVESFELDLAGRVSFGITESNGVVYVGNPTGYMPNEKYYGCILRLNTSSLERIEPFLRFDPDDGGRFKEKSH